MNILTEPLTAATPCELDLDCLHTITPAPGNSVVTADNQQSIRSWLCSRLYDHGICTPPENVLPDDWDWHWIVTGRKAYVGTLPKRISKYIYKVYSTRLTHLDLSQLGTFASRNLLKNDPYFFDCTRNFDWTPGHFSDMGSCFWGGRTEARTLMLPRLDAFAFRLFRQGPSSEISTFGKYYADYKDGYFYFGAARVWGIPCCLESPIRYHDQHQVMLPKVSGGCILFNAYGVSLVEMARIFATIHGLNYECIGLTANADDDGTLYINRGEGYLLTPQPLHVGMADIKLPDPESYTCHHCWSTFSAYPETHYTANIHGTPHPVHFCCEECVMGSKLSHGLNALSNSPSFKVYPPKIDLKDESRYHVTITL